MNQTIGNDSPGVTGDRPFDGATVQTVADTNDKEKHAVILRDEEGFGHVIRDHVGKSDNDLLDATGVVQRGNVTILTPRTGSFVDERQANDYVNQTLRANRERVDAVARGLVERDFLYQRFGNVTGREAVQPTTLSLPPYLRNTYGVGVEIRHDPDVLRGFRVRTAYPANEPLIGR